ncbi:MAG: UDP-3-O-acyl-N-acetylglucosamine deacetylase, partial [Cyanobacteria bacterium J06632_22]
RTLISEAGAIGIGLHLGQQTTVRLLPAEPGAGRYFVRTDLPGDVKIPATAQHVVKTQLSTELAADLETTASEDSQPTAPLHTVRTVEHCLAALWAAGLDDVRIEIDGPELPLLDGSAQGWVAAIRAGLPSGGDTTKNAASNGVGKKRLPLTEPVSVQFEDAFVTAFPSAELRFTYGIDFDLPAIGNQWHSWSPSGLSPSGLQDSAAVFDSFAAEIAPARTFGLAHQIDYLRSQGLIKGGSLENALVCSAEGWLNPPLRFENEPARHKLLDLVGDLSLLPNLPVAHYLAYKASHTLHVSLAKKLAERCPLLPEGQ